MSSAFKGKSKKSKADPGQETGVAPPNIRVEDMPPELPRERSFRHKATKKLQNLFIRSSNSRATSRGPSKGGKSEECLPVLDTTANLNVGDKSRFGEIMDDRGESLYTANKWMGLVDEAFEDAIVDAEDQCVNFPMSTSDDIAGQAPQDTIQASKRQVQGMRTIAGGMSRERKLDKGKGRDIQAEELGGAGGLVISGHLHQDYDNPGTPETGDRNNRSVQGVTSQFQGAHHVAISGDPHFENIGVKNEYYYASHAGTYDIPILKEFVSFNAMHDSSAQDPTRRVHPGTRQRVLKSIRDWIATPSAKERIFWLHGPAGVGKSAIAQTIAHSCARENLAATFFFFRSDPGRNDGNRLFTTLAWQFAYSIPATKNALIRFLIERPDICRKTVETQFEELIIKPFLELKRSGVQLSAPVVIIDGVDECSDESLQRRFLKIIGNTVKDDRVPLRFLICSRPEAHIQDTIDIFQSLTLPLDLAKLDDANHDIEIYLRAEFSRIATEQDLDPAWPGEQIIQELVYKASGQFIYASTVVKYVGDEHSGAETQLDIIRGLKPPSNISPFAELDELYKEILRRQRDPVFLKDFLSLFIGRNGTGRDVLHKDDAMLMNVSEMELHRKLRGMRSLLKFEPYINVHHRSFLDFLQDSSRSGQYHIDKETGTRRYLEFIVDALVRYASTVIEGHDDHKIHFSPQFRNLANHYPAKIVLPVEQWQEALQPLLDFQNKLLTLPNFRSTWEFLPCNECTGFHTIRDLLLHLTFFLGASDHVLNSALITEFHSDRSEEMHNSVIPLIPTETEVNALKKDLNTCLSALLSRLRRRKFGISLDTDTIQLMCSLLCFDRVEAAMRLQSMLDAQILMDAIDELINNKYSCSDFSADMSCKAIYLALEVYARVPVLPSSLFSKGTVSPHHDIWPTSQSGFPETELLFQIALMCKILDPSYIMQVLWVYEDSNRLFSVVGNVNENNESLSEWRKRSNPSSVIRIRIMLSVAKAIRYFHSTGIVLHCHVDSDDIFLDSELHARFRFFGLTTRYLSMTPYALIGQLFQSYEANISFFGCLFYEMCFAVEISLGNEFHSYSDAVSKRPLEPEIRDDEWQLIQRCCAEELKSRPTIDEVVREMKAWELS